MKTTTKRILSFLMAMVLCISLVPAVSLTADAATVTYNRDGNYVYNWGSRGTTATFLSPMAEAFYEDNNVSYSTLSGYAGSSSVGSVPSSALYQQLKSLMTSNHSYKTSYDATKDLYQYTDCQNGGGKISSFYSGNAIGPAWGQGGWNREHTWPNSKGLGGQDENDIMMLRPTSTSENSSRGNTAYGKSSSYYDPNKYGQSLHGDVARIMLYTYVRWGNTGKMWGQDGVMENREVLLEWMEEDPVDTWELGRNDAVEAITGTRNVFVDYPELAFILFGEEVPTNYTTPSGGASGGVTYTITAVSSNPAMGTVSVAGRTITATPAAGYEVSGYTVLSGTASVTQSGNKFTVQATTDVTVQITFVQKVPVPTVSSLNTGDRVVIFAPAYNKALSSETVATHYLKGVDVFESSGAITGYGSTEIWTVTKNTDDTYSFAYGNQKLGMAAEYTSMRPGETNDKWQLIGLGGTAYNIKNTVRGNYMEWYASKDNWSTYTNPSDDQFQLSIYVIGKGLLTGGGTTPETPVTPPAQPEQPSQPGTTGTATKLTTLPQNGDEIVIYNSQKAMGSVASGSKIAAVSATVTGDQLTVTGDMAVLTVVTEGSNYIFKLGDKYLTSGATGNAMSYESTLTDCGRWTMESAGNGAWYITNVGAAFNGNHNQAMEFYSGFTTYGIKQTEIYQMQLFKVGQNANPNPNPDPNPNPNPNPNPDPEQPPVNPPATNDGVLELTVDSLGIAMENYYTGTATVEGIALDLTQIGNYGNGIQMRDKEGKTSILFNTTALPGKITKIELTFNSVKNTFDNADAVIFSFGASQDDLTYTTKLSTVTGTKNYTITPQGDNTFFRIEHDLGYTMYWDSIKVYYEATEPAPDPTEQLAAPVVEGTNDITGRGKLTWSAVPGADAYRIFCGDQYGSRFHVLDTTTQLQYVEDFSEVGEIYVYLVVAVDLDDETRTSDYSNEVEIRTICATPTFTVQAGSAGKPVLTWNKVIGAKKYEIWRSVDGAAFKKLTTTKKLTYTDSKATAGTECTYKIKALGAKSSYNSQFSEENSCCVICAAPSITLKLDKKTQKPSLSWKKVTGAKSYDIYRSQNGGEYELLMNTTSVSYKDQTAATDNTYSYYVITVGKAEVFNSVASTAKSIALAIKAPKLTGSATAEGAPVVSWAAVENAVSYNVYRSTKSSKGYVLVDTVEDLSYTDTSVAVGKTYYYKVVAVGTNTESAMSAYLKLSGKCAAPEISASLNETSGKPVISWEKVDGAKKYTVYRATSENGKYSKLGTSKTSSYTDTKAVPGTTYFYKVVANGSSSKYNSIYSQPTEGIIGYSAAPVVTVKNNSKGQITVSWKKVSEAEKYYVGYVDVTELESEEDVTEQYILDNLQYVEVSKKKTSVTLTGAQTGRIYMILVVAVPKNQDYWNISEPDYAAATCAAPKITGKYIMGYNCATWKDVPGAERYAIYRSTKKNGDYVFLGYIDDDPSFADLNAVRGKTYYYKVTACTQYTESQFSNIIKMKTK